MNIGICGVGTVASWISSILNQLGDENICLYGCAGRSLEKAEEFAEKFNVTKAYDSMDALLADPDIDICYIAVPNQAHYDLCKKAIAAGKNVICEKPFAVNEKEAKEVLDLAAAKHLFISEALWPSFLPVRKAIDDEIAAGTIGELQRGEIVMLDNVLFLDRVKKLELGGGSLLDGGPYTLGFMTDHFGTDIASVKADVRKFETGVDAEDNITVTYRNGVTVTIRQTMDIPREQHDEYGLIVGTKGSIRVDCVSNPRTCVVMDTEGGVIKNLPIPAQIHNQGMPPVSGYEHEFMAFQKALAGGLKEASEVPHAQTLAIAHVMDEVRRQAGIRFPFEDR